MATVLHAINGTPIPEYRLYDDPKAAQLSIATHHKDEDNRHDDSSRTRTVRPRRRANSIADTSMLVSGSAIGQDQKHVLFEANQPIVCTVPTMHPVHSHNGVTDDNYYLTRTQSMEEMDRIMRAPSIRL